jgi:hypothetical protein
LYAIQRQRQLTSEAGQSSALPFQVTRSVPAAPEREAGESFEETYPKHSFSGLVRLGVAFARLIGAWRRRGP